jgi:acyl-CoA dehydrogenase
VTELALPPEVSGRRAEVRAFMEEHVYPNEAALAREDDAADELVAELREKARAAGIWAPHLPPEAGGTGSGFLEYAFLNEEIGRSMWAQLVFNCQAPDAGNGEILHLFGTEEQKERFLKPLVEGTARSFFSMTEPEVSGADPTGLRTTAVLDGDEWVIDGHKWFSSSAEGAAFGIVMAVTDQDAPPHRRMSQILVPSDTAGYELVRPIPVLGHAGRGWSTHCEVRYTGVRVPRENLLGEPGDGFRIAQKRLGPGRIHHVMRWLGQMQRAFELMCSYALEREVGGEPLAERQTVQNWIADSAAQMQAARLMTLHAAWKIDSEGPAAARTDVSMIKFHGAQVLHDVIDRALQIHGSLGYSTDMPLEAMYRFARGARLYDGPDEVHRQSVARQILRGYDPPPDEVPSEHIPTRRAAARERFAELLDAVTSND